MSGLRTNWTREQVRANLDVATEVLPESPTVDRFRSVGRSSGIDVRAGEDSDGEPPSTEPSDVLRTPPDPPLQPSPASGSDGGA